MKTPAQAIRIGIDTYYKTYQDAVAKFWEHGKQVAGLPIEHWLIAQAVQESRFDNLATSPVGAKGIAQFMETTANDVANDLKHLDLFKNGFNREDATQSIYAQVYYMNKLFKTWKWQRTDASRMQLALASYNAGAGNIIQAQKLSGSKKHWLEIKNYLGKVTGNNEKETVKYVSVITDFAIIIEDYKQD
jgi:soluble lytic murein transglycosylase-like protein